MSIYTPEPDCLKVNSLLHVLQEMRRSGREERKQEGNSPSPSSPLFLILSLVPLHLIRSLKQARKLVNANPQLKVNQGFHPICKKNVSKS